MTGPTHPATADALPSSDSVGALAEAFLERRRRGERPTIDDYAAQYPEHAAEIRRLFPALLMMEELKPGTGDMTGTFGGVETVAGTRRERLGDFRILREVGRGGMGVVYEAEQESLGRRVALKVLASPDLLDSRHLARFEREAKAAARLHHTNIVPVFGVGQADGVHYYVMQFIQGVGLDEVLREVQRLDGAKAVGAVASMAQSLITGQFDPAVVDLATDGTPARAPESVLEGRSELTSANDSSRRYGRSVARIGLQVAEALEYAHAQGTLHRDVKPSNLLLDGHGTVWVADFGLAKSADSDDLTHTGDIVGTLRYMAPERFDGRCDARSDVYALGLTLYELLAKRPAFDESDRGRLIAQVTRAEPPRLRTIVPSLPRDLETVVHKAIEREPAHRYATAAALAEDLRRFLEDRPITARRVGAAEQLGRWCRRNPLVASLAAAVFILLVALATGSTLAAFQIQRREVRANAEARRADAESLAARQSNERLRTTLYDSQMMLAEEAWESYSLPRMRELLEQQRPRPGETDLRGWEWHYWDRRGRVELLAFKGHASWPNDIKGHPGWVHDAAFRPDGAVIVSAGGSEDFGPRTGKDGDLFAWDAATGRELWSVRRPGSFRRVAFHPDGTRVAVLWTKSADSSSLTYYAIEAEVLIVDAVTGRTLVTIPLQTQSHGDRPLVVTFRSIDANCLAFTPDGARVILTLARTTDDKAGSPKDRRVSKTTWLWDSRDGRELLKVERNWAPAPTTLDPPHVISPDARRFAVVEPIVRPEADGSSPYRLSVWDTVDGREAATFPIGTRPIKSLAFNHDGSRLATASGGQPGEAGELTVWNVADGHAAWTAPVLNHQVRALAFSPDGSRLAAGLPAWDPARRGFQRGGVKVWDAGDGRELVFQTECEYLDKEILFGPDGTWLALTSDPKSIRVLDSRTGRVTLRLSGHSSTIAKLVRSPDGQRLASASQDGTVRIWDLGQRNSERSYSTGLAYQSGLFGAMEFSPDGRVIAVGSSSRPAPAPATEGGDPPRSIGTVTLLDTADGRERLSFKDGPGSFVGVAFRPDGHELAGLFQPSPLASAPPDRTPPHELVFWDLADGRQRRRFTISPSAMIFEFGFSPDGSRIVIPLTPMNPSWSARASDQSEFLDSEVRVLDANDGRTLAVIPCGGLRVLTARFSPDGTRLAWAGSSAQSQPGATPDMAKMTVCDGANGRELVTWSVASHSVSAVQYSRDGARIAALVRIRNEPSEVRVWDAGTGKERARLGGQGTPIWTYAFSPDGRRVATGGIDSTVRVWNVDSGQVLLELRVPDVAQRGQLSSVAFSPDGRQLAVLDEVSRVWVWDATPVESETKHARTGPD